MQSLFLPRRLLLPGKLNRAARQFSGHSPWARRCIEGTLLFGYRFFMEDRDSKPCVITVAITGSLPRKENNPAVPITVSEQVESTHAAFEAGATVVHLHVRNDD